jgi:glycosyltransferase involved in cell wall biosynthesis
MPEIVTHGANGFLLNADSESPRELADLVNTALASKGMKELAEQQSAKAREYYSWDRVARDMVRIIERERGRTP